VLTREASHGEAVEGKEGTASENSDLIYPAS